MGQKIVLSGVTFTDTTLPILRADPMLSAGSIFLFDPSHSAGSIAGVPINASTIPNIAWREAAALIGSGTESTLAGTVGCPSPSVANEFLVERTVKGGVHAIITQTEQTATNRQWFVNLPVPLRDYLYTHLSDEFYFSIWTRITRRQKTSASPMSHLQYMSTTSNYLVHMANAALYPSATPPRTGSHYSPAVITNTLITEGSTQFLSIGVDGISGTGPASTNTVSFGGGVFGPSAGSNTNLAPSVVIYRTYVENLTASGRSFSEVRDIDYALYQAAFAVGGRYYNDSYTDPATLP